jgi:hypothetical protein
VACDLDAIVLAIEGKSCLVGREFDVHDAVESALGDLGVAFEREVPLGAGARVDFLVDGNVGLEVKVKGSLSDVTRQLWRYAKVERVGSLLLVTTIIRLCHVPKLLLGKPVRVALIQGGWM